MKLPDLHFHTNLSDGEFSPKQAVNFVRRRGYLPGVADHFSPYHKMWDEYYFDAYIKALSVLKCWRSLELCVGYPPQLSKERWQQLDYVVAGVHTLELPDGRNQFLWAEQIEPIDPQLAADSYIDGFERFLSSCEHVDIFAHPAYIPRHICPQNQDPWSDDRIERIVQICQEHSIALEISGHWHVPTPRMIEVARAHGVMLSTACDGHSERSLADMEYPKSMVEQLGIKESEIFFPKRQL